MKFASLIRFWEYISSEQNGTNAILKSLDSDSSGKFRDVRVEQRKTEPRKAITHNRLYWGVLGWGGMVGEALPSKRPSRDSNVKPPPKREIGQGNSQGRNGNLSRGEGGVALCLSDVAQEQGGEFLGQRSLKSNSVWYRL